jgi:hypothetical protein
MALHLHLVVDTNDADYASSLTKISPETLAKIKPIIEKLVIALGTEYGTIQVDYVGHDPETLLTVLDNEEYYLLSEYFPSTENGFHSIESVKVVDYDVLETLPLRI